MLRNVTIVPPVTKSAPKTVVSKHTVDLAELFNIMRHRSTVQIMLQDRSMVRGKINGIALEDGTGRAYNITLDTGVVVFARLADTR